eukprot:6562410-Heterocapsa_arctica.AAC.1
MAGLPPGRELRKDRPAPPAKGDPGARRYWSIYIDNYMETEFKQWDELSMHVDTFDWQLAIRE